MSDGGLVLVAPAPSDVLADSFYIRIIGVMGSFELEDAHWNHTEPSGSDSPLLKLCETARISENRIWHGQMTAK